jgi:hypothetical protein
MLQAEFTLPSPEGEGLEFGFSISEQKKVGNSLNFGFFYEALYLVI